MARLTRRHEPDAPNGSVERLSQEEAKALVNRQAQKFLKMSGEDFARRYRAGEIEHPHRLAVARVAVLLPLVED